MPTVKFNSDGTATVTNISMLTGKTNKMTMALNVDQYSRWMRGQLIQYAMPHLSADQREFFLTGSTPEEWNAVFGAKEARAQSNNE